MDDGQLYALVRVLFMNVAHGQRVVVRQLLPSKDQALLIWWNILARLDLQLELVHGGRRLDLDGNALASEGLYNDLHGCVVLCWLVGE